MHPSQVINSFLDQPGAYLHVPFCGVICPFCPYNKVPYQPELARRYFAALETEIALYRRHLAAPFTSLYIGGGTPTLCLEPLASIVAAIPVAGERAIEVHPSHATRDRIEALQQLGITYISLGVQSFNGDVLRYLQRPSSPATNLRALDNVAGAFSCVDVDLIFDVSFADESIFLEDLTLCLEHGVDQISTYPLMRFGFTPFGKSTHERRKEHAVLQQAEELAARYGYERRSVWTFNRPGTSSYSSITRSFYLGMGAGSASYTGPYFLVNHFGLEQYCAKLEAGVLPLARRWPLPRLISATYAAFWQAYTGRIDAARFSRHFTGLSGLFWRQALDVLVAVRYFRRNNGIYRLTPAGRNRYHDLERWVTYRFIEPLWAVMMKEHEQHPVSTECRLNAPLDRRSA